MSAAKKKRVVADESDEIVESVIARDNKARSLDDVVTALAQAGTDAATIRKAVEPILFAYVVARGEVFVHWAIHCEWRGKTLRFVVTDAQGEEADLRAIPLPRRNHDAG